VQKNNRVTSEEVGELAGLSATACQRRRERLRSEGIIETDISIVSPKAVGRRIQMLVLVSLERERADIIDKFKKAVKSSVDVTGDADFVLYVTARTMEDYEEFTRNFLCEPRHKGIQDDGRVRSDKGGLCRTDRVFLRGLIEVSGFSKASRLTIAAATTIAHIDFR